MKKVLFILLIVMTTTQPMILSRAQMNAVVSHTQKKCSRHAQAALKAIGTSFQGAKESFARMRVSLLQHLDINSLTKTQLAAFKELFRELFLSQIASASCESPAHREKAEVMFQLMAHASPT